MKLKSILHNILKSILVPTPLKDVDKVSKVLEIKPDAKYIFLFDKNQISEPKMWRLRLPEGSARIRVWNVDSAIRAYEIVKDKECED